MEARSLESVLELYSRHLQSRNFSPLTVRQVVYGSRACLTWLRDNLQITDAASLNATHLEAWEQAVAEHRTARKTPLKPRSINKKIEMVRGFLRFLSSRGFIAADVISGLEYVREPRLLPRNVMKHQDVRRLLESVPTKTLQGYRDRTMLELLYSTGMRIGEILGLDVAGVDLATKTARVTGKGSKERVVPIGKAAVRFLDGYIRDVRPLLLNRQDETALFLDQTGKRMSYATARRMVHSRAQRAGLGPEITAHSFRRSCATELLRNGAGIYHVKELLGHETLETLKHYVQLTIRDLQDAHRRFHPREADGEGTFTEAGPAAGQRELPLGLSR